MNRGFTIVILTTILVFFCSSCQEDKKRIKNDNNINEQNLADLTWQDSVVNLGDIKSGKGYSVIFVVKNISNNPLLFQRIESTCGCTLIDKKIDTPLLSGKIDSILAQFKMSDTKGYVERKIYVLANTKRKFYVLRIKANIVD